jgi:hypothetical protein
LAAGELEGEAEHGETRRHDHATAQDEPQPMRRRLTRCNQEVGLHGSVLIPSIDRFKTAERWLGHCYYLSRFI